MSKVCVSCGDGIEEPKLSEDDDEMCKNCGPTDEEEGGAGEEETEADM